MLLEHQDVISESSCPSRLKKLSKKTSSKILLSRDGSCWKTFDLIDSLIKKGKLKPKSDERASVLYQPDGNGSQRHHIVPIEELDGVSIALVARFGVISKSTDRIFVFHGDEEEAIKVTEKKNIENDIDDETLEVDKIFNIKESKNHPLDNDPKTSHLEVVKSIFRYIKGTTHLGLWYLKRTGIEIVVYSDFDHVGDYVDRKGTSGICTFVRCYLTSWFSKKQTALAISTTETEYGSAEKACQQALWMKQSLIGYDIRLDNVPIMYENKGAIDLSKNLVQRSRTKHVEIHHYFLQDNVQKGNISIEKVSSKDNIADILTKPIKHESFNYLRLGLRMVEHIP
nr:copia protein [Tanacetum cinerariifolium]